MAFTHEQLLNARTIIGVGQSLGMSNRDIVIGLMTAMQESGLRNLHYGDRDSQGLFQQRPSQGWGTVAQVTDPTYAATKFFDSLKGVKNRNKLSLSAAAQAVQRSAFPDAYAKHAGAAQDLLTQLAGTAGAVGGAGPAVDTTEPAAPVVPAGPGAVSIPDVPSNTPDTSTSGTQKLGSFLKVAGAGEGSVTPTNPLTDDPYFSQPPVSAEQYAQAAGGGDASNAVTTDNGVVNGSDLGSQIVNYAKSFLGTPYKWGGTSPLGFDCSGLTQYVFKKFGIDLPRVSYQQGDGGTAVSSKGAKPGDLIFWDENSRNNGADHVGIYLGGGKYLAAPKPGDHVKISSLWGNPWFRRYT